MIRSTLTLFACAIVIFLGEGQLEAGTIIKTIGGSATGNDVSFNGASIAGAMETGFEYTGFLKSVVGASGINKGSLVVGDIEVVEFASVPGIAISASITKGGFFAIRDDNDELALAGTFGAGLVEVNPSRAIGGFKSDDVQYTDGNLLKFIEPVGSFSLSLSGITNVGVGSPFDATITAQISAEPRLTGVVPEPTSAMVFAPILLCLAVRRRS